MAQNQMRSEWLESKRSVHTLCILCGSTNERFLNLLCSLFIPSKIKICKKLLLEEGAYLTSLFSFTSSSYYLSSTLSSQSPSSTSPKYFSHTMHGDSKLLPLLLSRWRTTCMRVTIADQVSIH